MGLQNQLNDVSSDSIPLLFVALVATFVNHLRSSVFALLHSLGLIARPVSGPENEDGSFLGSSVGSGLTGLVVLADQLAINRHLSYRYDRQQDHRNDGDSASRSSDCVVCLCTLKDGDQVRMLQCRHVFHKHCFDGWLDHLNFNCPLCRSPVVHRERVGLTGRRLARDLLHWFSPSVN